MLPALTAWAGGGSVETAVPLCAAWILFLAAANLFDDIQDGEGDLHHIPAEKLLSFGLFALGAAQDALSYLKNESASEIQQAFGRTMSLAARAQIVSAEKEDDLLAHYFKVTAGKAGLIFATGAWSGARLATNDPEIGRRFYKYGLYTGMTLQILDDCDDLRQHDLPVGAWTLPVLYGLSRTQHPRHAQLRRQLDASDPSLGIILAALDEMEAVSWSRQVARLYQQKALAALGSLPPAPLSFLRRYVTRNETN